jgi:CRP-like cAMP-binding protein
MRDDSKPELRKLAEGKTLTEQGEEGADLYLLLDGVLTVEVDGRPLADVGPGAILGERSLLEGGTRTSTLRAATRCKVAVFSADRVDERALAEVAGGHRREEAL